MAHLFGHLEHIAKSHLSVLIQGETGVGKEEVARAIHHASTRASCPFVVIDCTSIPHSLAESILFGHERGAFTGALERRIGLFELAHKGTLFFDELGDLPLAIQAKCLRAIERREVLRVGSLKPLPVDFRVLSATHRPLKALCGTEFRSDLYYRIAEDEVFVPSLRERPQDIEDLAKEFAKPKTILQDAMTNLLNYSWPGNVRELRNVVRRASALSMNASLQFDNLAPLHADPQVPTVIDTQLMFHDAKTRFINHFERIFLSKLMHEASGNLSRAAKKSGMTRHHLRDLLKKHDLLSKKTLP